LSRSKIIKQLKKKNPKLNQSELQDIIDVFSDCISKALKEGKSVEIRGMGRFSCKKLKENFNARNPSTNELIYKPERVKVRFNASKNLKKLINE
jgi:nucleoid DNA-binding protein